MYYALSPTARRRFAGAVLLPKAAVCLIPDDLPAEDGQASSVTSHTAHVSLIRRANLLIGGVGLVHAGAGGARVCSRIQVAV